MSNFVLTVIEYSLWSQIVRELALFLIYKLTIISSGKVKGIPKFKRLYHVIEEMNSMYSCVKYNEAGIQTCILAVQQ